MARESHWLPIFNEFVADLRINSKEVATGADGGGARLELWESQKRFLQEVAYGLDSGVRTFYCLKSRQLGITTVSLAIDLFWLATHPGIVMALVTENEKNRNKNRATLKQYLQSFPDGYFGEKFQVVKDNRTSMSFSNGSRIDFLVAGTKDRGTAWGEGEGYSAVHLTEIASYGSVEGLRSFEEAFAQTNPDRIYIYESTAKGFNHWRDTWLSGFNDQLTKRSFFIGWWASATNRIELSDPRFAQYGMAKPNQQERELIRAVKSEYDFDITDEQIAWYRWREHTGSNDGGMLLQNQPWTADQAFIASGQSFFPNRMVAKDIKQIEDGGELYGYLAYRYDFGNSFFDMKLRVCEDDIPADDIELRIWEEPVREAHYVIGCDPAYGRTEHGDQICIQVYRCFADKMVQVAEYATAQVEVKYAAWVLAHLAGAYGNCMVNLELGGGGRIIMNEWDHIRTMLNADMYKHYSQSADWENALDQARWYLYSRVDTVGGRPAAYNFETSWRTKQELMHGMRGAYVTRELEVRSTRLLFEMLNVIQDGSTIGAPDSSDPDSKDDRVFASAFAHRAWVNWIRTALIQEGLTFEHSRDIEKGNVTQTARTINGMVQRFWKNMAIAAQAEEERPTWRTERGL